MQCRDFREIADSYLSDELLVETNHEVLRHLESCADCRAEFSARRELKVRLRDAVKNSPQSQMREGFRNQLREHLRVNATQQKLFRWSKRAVVLAIAASVLLFVTAGALVLRQKLSSSNLNTSVRNLAAEALAHFAVGDHKNCALTHNLKEMPISLEEASRKFDRSYYNLDQSVLKSFENSNDKIEILGAHACVFEGKRFAHIVMRRQGRIISLLVTDKGNEKENISHSTNAISCQPLDGFQISCFETARHAVFVVSDMSEEENLSIARTLLPSMMSHLS